MKLIAIGNIIIGVINIMTCQSWNLLTGGMAVGIGIMWLVNNK